MFQKFGLCVALILFAAGSCRAQWGAINDKSVPNISVSGGAEIKVAPDEVHLSLGVESRDPKLETAKKLNDEKLAAVMTFLKGLKIEAKDIQTDFIGIRPHYSDSEDITPSRFDVQQGIDIKLRRVSDYDAALTGVLKHGATHIHGIEFRTTELRKHRDAARKLAIKAAKEKATALASELDVKVGRVMSISENSWGGSFSGNYFGSSRYGFGGGQQVSQGGGETGDGESVESSTLSVGLISVGANVHLTFVLE
jgi:uncharacterized protein